MSKLYIKAKKSIFASGFPFLNVAIKHKFFCLNDNIIHELDLKHDLNSADFEYLRKSDDVIEFSTDNIEEILEDEDIIEICEPYVEKTTTYYYPFSDRKIKKNFNFVFDFELTKFTREFDYSKLNKHIKLHKYVFIGGGISTADSVLYKIIKNEQRKKVKIRVEFELPHNKYCSTNDVSCDFLSRIGTPPYEYRGICNAFKDKDNIYIKINKDEQNKPLRCQACLDAEIKG